MRQRSPGGRVRTRTVQIEPSRRQLVKIGALFDRGELESFVNNVLPLESAPAAYFGRIPRATGHGKVVVQIAA